MKKKLVEKLYEYLKDKYGIQGTETSNRKIPLRVEINIPNVAKNSDKHKWVIFLEKQNSKEVNTMIIGQEWKDEHCSWSRYIEVKNNDSHIDFAWFKIIDNTHIGHGYDFKTLIIFINILTNFSSFYLQPA